MSSITSHILNIYQKKLIVLKNDQNLLHKTTKKFLVVKFNNQHILAQFRTTDSKMTKIPTAF